MNDYQRQVRYLTASHIAAAAVAEEALAVLVKMLGNNAMPILDDIETRLKERYEGKGILAELELMNVVVLKPAFSEIERLITAARSSV